MKIKRKINGETVEITLTKSEIKRAYSTYRYDSMYAAVLNHLRKVLFSPENKGNKLNKKFLSKVTQKLANNSNFVEPSGEEIQKAIDEEVAFQQKKREDYISERYKGQ